MAYVVIVTKSGFKQMREVPEEAHSSEYHKGVLIGPPDFSDLGWSSTRLKALNNDLVDAGFIEYVDIRGRRREFLSVIRKHLRGTDKLPELRNKLFAIYQASYYPEIFGGF